MRSLIVIPRSKFLDSDKVFPHLGPYYIKKYVEDNSNHMVEVVCGDPNCYDGYSVIGISATTPQYSNAIQISRRLPEEIITVIGGSHVTNYGCNDFFDYCIEGDGCEQFLSILEDRIPKTTTDNCDLIPYRGDYLWNYEYWLDGKRATTMLTSRGCPFNCAFCEHASTKLRLKSIPTVRKEIQQIVDLGFNRIMFFDDLFCLNLKRVKELCNVIQEFDIKFRCFAHANNFTEEMAKLLSESGCIEIGYGAESMSQKILDCVNKRTTVKQNYDIINTAHKYGIKVKSFLMIGLPGEDKESVKNMEKFIKTSGVDDFDVTIFYPYKGTRIAENVKEYDLEILPIESKGWYKGKLGSAECIVRTKNLSAKEIRTYRDSLYSHNKRFKNEV